MVQSLISTLNLISKEGKAGQGLIPGDMAALALIDFLSSDHSSASYRSERRLLPKTFVEDEPEQMAFSLLPRPL